MTVRYRADLRVPYAANSDTGRILLPPGLDWPTEHARLDRCFLYLVGGVQMAPEFDKSTAVVPPVRQSNVVPMLRRPW